MVENTKFQSSYSYAFIDETTKKEIRRKMLKAVCIPGYQVPYSSPEMPISRGWGTGGLHLTLSLIGPHDVFKIIDQGSDASVNACNLREFVKLMTGCEVTFDTAAATIIQSRHRIPEEILTDRQILVLQVPQPEILRGVERYEFRTRQMHAEARIARVARSGLNAPAEPLHVLAHDSHAVAAARAIPGGGDAGLKNETGDLRRIELLRLRRAE